VSVKIIENYEPDDRGWGIVVGRFMQPTPEPKDEQQQGEGAEEHDD
jgi:hypothetical protein